MGIQEESLLSSSTAEVQNQRAPGSNGLVDLWDGLVIKITSFYN